MSTIKVLTVFGTRPEAIKLAPILAELKRRPDAFTSRVCVTAQHRQMLDSALYIFGITPDYDLDVMQPSQSLFRLTGAVLDRLEPVLEQEKPDVMLVQGDTTTTFAACLGAYYKKVKIGHVEAGLRTNHKYQPFPEEINRRMTTHVADWHFAPTDRSRENLLREGVDPASILVTGNTVVDALLEMVSRQSELSVANRLAASLREHGVDPEWKCILLVTGHRRENFGEGMEQVCSALKAIALRHPDVNLVYPVHLNPNVQEPVHRILGGIANVHLVAPLDYESFVFLLSKSKVVLTDSGGIQEEAPGLGIPVFVTRNTTERPEGVEAGVVKLVGTNAEEIVGEISQCLASLSQDRSLTLKPNPYGDGHASVRIVEFLESKFAERSYSAVAASGMRV